ncbi:hypothetical protein HGP05_03800 [Streptococcus sanguinis]|uniref:Uncharacterized protein n=1 Tax=Streptococcus sanguinis TaxID=1305 RepID=A0A7Y0VB91_STRSA|nr:hypothetical protein [Streptococcus sanguinis]
MAESQNWLPLADSSLDNLVYLSPVIDIQVYISPIEQVLNKVILVDIGVEVDIGIVIKLASKENIVLAAM